jgi:anthranilate synthase/aminodeoxychorismate synthase-like glutamine amidotransferase
MILLIDNYDSFVHNLARYLRRLGQETLVVRNDAVSAAEALDLRPKAIILSPGPCTPHQAGCTLDLVRCATDNVPFLGVCLGHQTIGAAFGGKIVRAGEPMHGRASQIQHQGTGIFAGLPNPLSVGRYHSLIVEESSLSGDLEVTARTDDGVIMALAHRRRPVFGVQFHPESILTDGGYRLLANFLRLAGIEPLQDVPSVRDERPVARAAVALPTGPVTF